MPKSLATQNERLRSTDGHKGHSRRERESKLWSPSWTKPIWAHRTRERERESTSISHKLIHSSGLFWQGTHNFGKVCVLQWLCKIKFNLIQSLIDYRFAASITSRLHSTERAQSNSIVIQKSSSGGGLIDGLSLDTKMAKMANTGGTSRPHFVLYDGQFGQKSPGSCKEQTKTAKVAAFASETSSECRLQLQHHTQFAPSNRPTANLNWALNYLSTRVAECTVHLPYSTYHWKCH